MCPSVDVVFVSPARTKQEVRRLTAGGPDQSAGQSKEHVIYGLLFERVVADICLSPIGLATLIVVWLLLSLLFCIAIGLSAKGN